MCALSLAAWCPALSDLSKRTEELLKVYTSVCSAPLCGEESPGFLSKDRYRGLITTPACAPGYRESRCPQSSHLKNNTPLKTDSLSCTLCESYSLPCGIPTAHVSGCSSLSGPAATSPLLHYAHCAGGWLAHECSSLCGARWWHSDAVTCKRLVPWSQACSR